MKGVLICGGSGTRLRPLTEVTNKSLLPIYDQPLIFYPLQVLLQAGIRDIIVISGPEHLDQMAGFLQSGARFGCRFSYRVQDEPKGIAQALGMAQDFVGNDNVCAILGDNIYFDNLTESIRNFQHGGHVFLKQVPDAARFGVAEMNGSQVLNIEEKPVHPKSNLAVTGCYIYDNRCFEVINNLQPSPRGELEITDVSNWYASQGQLMATTLQDEWIDAGTIESLHQASVAVRERKVQHMQPSVDQAVQAAQQAHTTPTQEAVVTPDPYPQQQSQVAPEQPTAPVIKQANVATGQPAIQPQWQQPQPPTQGEGQPIPPAQ